jgi:adenylate kinase
VSRRLVFLGPPGAGKGTQAQVIGRKLGLAHVSTGDLLRKEVSDQSPLGRDAKGYMERGELVPDDLVVRMVNQRISQPDCALGFILDGFPRTRAQAVALQATTTVDRVYFLDVSEAALVKRLSRRRSCPKCGASYNLDTIPPKKPGVCDVCGSALVQRDDDKEETIKRRLTEYAAKTADLVRHYRDLGVLESIDASAAPEIVESALERSIRKLPA